MVAHIHVDALGSLIFRLSPRLRFVFFRLIGNICRLSLLGDPSRLLHSNLSDFLPCLLLAYVLLVHVIRASSLSFTLSFTALVRTTARVHSLSGCYLLIGQVTPE